MARTPATNTGRAKSARRTPHAARRTAIVEPVVGHMPTRQNATQLLRLGLDQARVEWLLMARACPKLHAHLDVTGLAALAMC